MPYLTRKSNRKYKYNGGAYTLPEIIEKTGCKIPYQTIYSRINRQNWQVEKAINTQSRKYTPPNPNW